MKKRLLSILLTLCMLLTLLPTAALAAENTTKTANSTISVETGGTTKYYDKQEDGWNAAAGAANTNGATVQLLADWKAAPADDTIKTSFGTGAGFGKQGYILVPANKTIILDLNDYTIDRELRNQSSAVPEGKVIEVKGNLTLKNTNRDIKITGKITGANSSNGGAVDVASGGGTFTMEGGSITGNNASVAGGVYVNGNFNMTGGKIYSNSANGANGAGGVYVSDTGTFNMSGGSITGNTAVGDKSAGGVYMVGGGTSFTMTGGSITGNTGGGAGGVLVADASNSKNIFIVGGTAKITGNKLTGGIASNVLLQNITGGDNRKITCATDGDALASGATIGVTTQTKPTDKAPVAITDQSYVNYSSFFFSDNADYETRNSGTAGAYVVQLLLNSDDDFAAGDGSASAPYQIANAEQLSRLTAKVNNGDVNYVLKYYQLKENIDLTDFGNWIPIGTATNAFKGSFDGNGKTITKLNVTGGNYSGLFGWIWDATVKKLTVGTGSVSGGQSTG
ncbi:MAG: hypothetical protein RSB55_08915, partial [Oscillospiraceae bacterium]